MPRHGHPWPARLQMPGVLTNHPDLVGLCPIAMGNLLQHARRRQAAGTGVVRGVGTKENSLNACAHGSHFSLHAQMNGVELIHIKTAAPNAGLIGCQGNLPASTIELRHRIEHAWLRHPVLERHYGVFTLGIESAYAVKDGELHKLGAENAANVHMIRAALAGDQCHR